MTSIQERIINHQHSTISTIVSKRMWYIYISKETRVGFTQSYSHVEIVVAW